MSSTFRSATIRAALLAAAALLATTAFAAKDKGYIKARGNPGDAGVFINGKYVGPATRFTVPEKYEAPLGEVQVTIRDPRCEDFSTKVTVKAGKTAHIHYKLTRLPPAKPPFGTLRLGGGEPESFMSVAAGDTGAVYLNDRFYGYVDELNNPGSGILLNPGTYDLHIDSPIFGDIHQKVTITANKVTVVPLPKKE
ncbi:MAG TPA: PEGA domain-containing protein [Bryobacteraceae bacterium]|nr:PEGA domain-containing protein [Bryobacteraceae bacterium]